MLINICRVGVRRTGPDCSVVPSDRTRGNGHKLKQRKLQLNMRKHFFPLRVTEPWPRLPREAVKSPSLEMFKTRPVQPALGDPAMGPQAPPLTAARPPAAATPSVTSHAAI